MDRSVFGSLSLFVFTFSTHFPSPGQVTQEMLIHHNRNEGTFYLTDHLAMELLQLWYQKEWVQKSERKYYKCAISLELTICIYWGIQIPQGMIFSVRCWIPGRFVKLLCVIIYCSWSHVLVWNCCSNIRALQWLVFNGKIRWIQGENLKWKTGLTDFKQLNFLKNYLLIVSFQFVN